MERTTNNLHLTLLRRMIDSDRDDETITAEPLVPEERQKRQHTSNGHSKISGAKAKASLQITIRRNKMLQQR